jgi:GNAT superfamily N-acetyltransferase
LYRAAQKHFPLISAVIQNRQRGQVFCDFREKPRSALVVTNFGFTLLVGAEQNKLFDAGLAHLFETEEMLKPGYLLWYSPPPRWQKALDTLVPDVVRRRERVRFEFHKESALWLEESTLPPEGFEVKDLCLDLIAKTEKLGVEIDSRFWGSANDFVAHGLGVCIMKDGEMVSLCYAAALVDRLAEVDVVTMPEFRSHGLGNLVTQQFIRECLSRGFAPSWDCFGYNIGSMKLADKLGFKEVRRYPFYSFNVPITWPQTEVYV